MEQEIWKDVKGYEGIYQVSNMGRIRHFKYLNKYPYGKIMYQRKKKSGYMIVQFKENGKIKSISVHRLVAEAFISNPENKPQIDHIDGNPSNNYVGNLRWATAKENSNNPISIQRKKDIMSIINLRNIGKKMPLYVREKISKSRIGKYGGTKNPFYGKKHSDETKKIISESNKGRGTIEIVQLSKDGTFIRYWGSASLAGKELKISPSSITGCCKGKRKTIGGFKWKYKKDYESNIQ